MHAETIVLKRRRLARSSRKRFHVRVCVFVEVACGAAVAGDAVAEGVRAEETVVVMGAGVVLLPAAKVDSTRRH